MFYFLQIWHVTINELGVALVNCVADLNRHQKSVNVVRFSPSGEFLATGDDGSDNLSPFIILFFFIILKLTDT